MNKMLEDHEYLLVIFYGGDPYWGWHHQGTQYRLLKSKKYFGFSSSSYKPVIFFMKENHLNVNKDCHKHNHMNFLLQIFHTRVK